MGWGENKSKTSINYSVRLEMTLKLRSGDRDFERGVIFYFESLFMSLLSTHTEFELPMYPGTG